MSLSHFTTQFLQFLIKDSLQLIKKNGEDEQNQSFNRQVVLKNILKILEVDRLLLYTFNAVVVEVLKTIVEKNHQKVGLGDNPDIVFIKESLRFVTMLFFKRAFLIMNILKSLTNAKFGAVKSQMAVTDN